MATLVASAGLFAAVAAVAEDGVFKVRESAFNEFAGAIEPITLSGHRTLTITVDTFLGSASVTVCNSDWTAQVSNLEFDINSARVLLTGDVDAEWCGRDFTGSFETTADVSYVAAQSAVLVSAGNTNVRPTFTVFGVEVQLPAINVGPTFTLPPVVIGTGRLYFETAAGPTSLHVTPQNVFLTKRDGFIEVQSDVAIW